MVNIPVNEEVVRAYKTLFDLPSGVIVLKDLEHYTWTNVPVPPGISNEDLRLQMGARNVYLRIMYMINFDLNQLKGD